MSCCKGLGYLSHHVINNRKALEEARHVLHQQSCAQSAPCGEDVTEEEAIIPTTDKEQGHREDIKLIDYQKYEYDFENIVFEGGGAKGIVYVGALEVGLNSSLFYLPFRVLFMIKIYILLRVVNIMESKISDPISIFECFLYQPSLKYCKKKACIDRD